MKRGDLLELRRAKFFEVHARSLQPWRSQFIGRPEKTGWRHCQSSCRRCLIEALLKHLHELVMRFPEYLRLVENENRGVGVVGKCGLLRKSRRHQKGNPGEELTRLRK